MDGVVSSDNFNIFSESDDHYFFTMKFNFGITTSHLINEIPLG